jgi:hypothetical protein
VDTTGTIKVTVDENAIDECLRLGRAVAGEEESKPDGQSVHEKMGELMRLSRIISDRFGYVPFEENGDRLATMGTRATGMFIKPSDALRNHYATMGTSADGPIENIVHDR